ncbi:hypothetical protein [Propioniciclava sinopodophylli]|nr:hypothetical protein [Propioniciclava sinopodophylli]
MSTWFEPDDEIARRLEQTLRQEADAMSIPENFDQVADAARAARRQHSTGIVAGVAAGLAVVALGGGFLMMQGNQPTTPAAPAPAPATSPTSPDASPTPASTPDTTPSSTPSPDPVETPQPSETPKPSDTPKPPASPEPKDVRVTGDQLGFASPTGNLVCTMDVTNGVRCHAMTANWTGKDVPPEKLENCGPEFGDFGPGQDVVLNRDGSFGSCVSEISVFEAVETNEGQPNTYGTEYRSWAGKGTELVEFLPGMKAYVLPYGTTAVTGRFSCEMATTGITCDDSRSDAGFHLSRNDLTLR